MYFLYWIVSGEELRQLQTQSSKEGLSSGVTEHFILSQGKVIYGIFVYVLIKSWKYCILTMDIWRVRKVLTQFYIFLAQGHVIITKICVYIFGVWVLGKL